MLEVFVQKNLEPEQFSWLKNRWDQLCQASDIPDKQTEKLFKHILKKYEKKARAYHNFSHVYSFLKIYDQHQTTSSLSRVFEWSIWMHDLVYNPLKKNNELKSAKKTRKLLGDYLSDQEITEIYEIILSTAHHQLYYQEFEHKLFLDIDLAVLAASEKTYAEYAKAIRQEYRMYPSFLYKKGRSGVIHHFLERDKIYFTADFQGKYESIARRNLKWELEEMG